MTFSENGWFVLDLIDPNPAFEVKVALTKKLQSLMGETVTLENYHLSINDDDAHTKIQMEMTQFFRNEKFGLKVIEPQLSFFKEFIGQDLLIQKDPYLRITRPEKPQDNIGYHRDTFYGGSPYEVSVLVPYVDLTAKSSLEVLSGSHTASETLFPTTKIQNTDKKITKGSDIHQLGFLYAPKLMNDSISEKMQGIPLKVGQALIFSLALVHGSTMNRGPSTRFSTDIRILNAFAPVDLSARPNYYETLCHSTVTTAAKQYLEVNTL
ncbi:MAG: phytanoyl-CoA dioxygenase family protein [Simkaniaceae bacterium]|nr:phytanoyl-CoA dioxygenase family protein [Simkaniaceae bacterium]